MTEKIREHIDALFRDAPHTNRVKDAREELLAGCLDKFADLLSAGRPPEDAYIAVISGIGDVDELLHAIGQIDDADPAQEQNRRKKRAFFISAGVFLYVMSVAAAVTVDTAIISRNNIYHGDLSAVVFLVLAAVATFVLMYGMMSTRTKVTLPRPSLSGEIQEQLVDCGPENKLRSAVTSSMWSLLTLIYLCLGFVAGWWHPGWLIFPLGAALQTGINLFFGKSKSFRANINGLIWTLTTFTYLSVSFLTDRWDITWLIFPLALCAQQIWNLVRIWRESDEK